MGGRRWSEFPSDPALVAEVERARDRRDWSKDQWAQALDWLEEQDFDLDAADIDQDTLEAAIAKQWVAKPDVLRRDEVVRLRGELESGKEPQPVEVEAISDLLKEHLSKNELKRRAVDAAIETLGVDALLKLRQKPREGKVMDFVVEGTQGRVTVTDRYVRERFKKAKERLCS